MLFLWEKFKKLVSVYKKIFCFAKRVKKITCHKEKSQPPPPGYIMVRPLGLLKQTSHKILL